MNFSLSVLTPILFLAPGIAGLFGSFLGARSRAVRSSLPPANSLGALIAIVLMAVTAHGVAALALTVQEGFCLAHACWTVGFEPNLYGQIVRLSRDPQLPYSGHDVALTLVALMLLCVVTGAVMMSAVALDMRRGARSLAAPIFFGWLASFDADTTGGSRVLIAYVLTKTHSTELAIGYRGMVENIDLTSDREIAAITLFAADRFGVRLTPPVEGQEGTVTLGELLPRVYVPGREIENVVLNVVEVDPPGADA